MFLPFDKYQERVNSKYYKRKGSGIYEDFSTFAYGEGRLSVANAREFYGKAKMIEGEARICELGIGDGSFAKAFLDEIRRLDSESGGEVCGRLSYLLVDLSERMLDDAKTKLSGHNVSFETSDALGFSPKKKFHYIRMNELLSDLPSKLIYRMGKEAFELGFSNENLVSEGFSGAPGMLGSFPDGYLFPLNVGALTFLKRLPGFLERGGYADVFDYGFSEISEALDEPREVWNDNVSRWYGEQVTVDINFTHLMEVFPKLEVESQKGYVERVLREKLHQVQLGPRLCYFTDSELKKNSAKLKKEGYSKESISGEFEEESDFYHARMSN